MLQDDFCHNCAQRHDCRQIYSQLGDSAGLSVVWKTVVAFLVPIAVFIAALTVFEKFLAEAFKPEKIRVAAVFLLSSAAAFLVTMLVRRLNLKIGRNG
jgi:hypothetical protein